MEGAEGTCRGAGGRRRGLAGLRADAPSKARGADGERAGRRPPAHTAAGPDGARNTSGATNYNTRRGRQAGGQAARRPEICRGNKRQQQDLLACEAVNLMHDEAAHGTHPRDSCNAEDARAPGADLQEVLETVAGSGGRGGHAEAPHGSAGR